MKKIRVGVIGVGRGRSAAAGAGPHLGMELVALCDTWEEKLLQVGEEFGVATYTDFDKFLEHDMDAVILANYFHQHAPFAVRALNAGKHVMSETSACLTLAEGVELIRTVERTGLTYMFAENYPFMVFNQEMRRRYLAGDIGSFMYGEAEYVHPMDSNRHARLSPGVNHWRNWIPATYYCTHALGPIMYVTDTWPTKVNGFVVPNREDDPVHQLSVRQNDAASMIALRMDDGSVVKLLQVYLRGHGVWVRIHGSRGAMENLRHGERDHLYFRQENYHEDAEPVDEVYAPDFPEYAEEAATAGHGGGDFFTNVHFANAIRSGEPPYLDVYRGVAMSIIGPLAYRSALDDSNTIDVPDFRTEAARVQYEDDHWSPDPAAHKDGDPLPSILGKREIPDKALDDAREIWRENGYQGD